MGGEAKVTVMLLKADLQCAKCYKKVKKVLCKLPQIRNQVYDEKANTVIITVVCCSPEKIRDKICSKGGGSIKSIEIKEQEKKPDKPKEADKKPDKPKDLEKKSDKPKEAAAEKPKEGAKKADKPKEGDKPKGGEAAKRPPEAAPVPASAAAITAIPAAYAAPMGCTCSDCYHAYGGGLCFQAYGTPIPYGRPVYDSWGSGGGGYRYKASYGCGGYEYFTEENPQSCSIM